MARDVPVQSVRKALDILSILAFEDLERVGMPLTALARRMGMPANSAHNLLKTMGACGYVAQTDAGAYVAGPRCVAMGRVASLVSDAVARAVRGPMDALARELGESVVFAVLADGRRTPLWRADGQQTIRADAASAETRGPFALPTGRVLAAHASSAELDLLLTRSGLPGAEWDGIHTRAGLETALERLRARGFEAIVPDGPDLASFAVPVKDGRDQPIGTLGCYAPLFRCGPERQAAILDALRVAARTIAAVL